MKWIRSLSVTLLILGFLFLAVLFCTEAGLRFIGKTINTYSGGMVSIGQIHGRLLNECSFGAIKVNTPGAFISVDAVKWSWNPERLLLGELRLATLTVSGIEVVLQENSETQSEKSDVVLPKTLLPFSLALENFLVEHLTVLDSSGVSLIEIATIGVGLEGNGRQLNIDRLTVEGSDVGFTLHGSVEAGEELSVDLMGKWHLAGFGFHPLQGSFSVQGPVETPHIEIGVNSSGVIRVGIDLVNLLQEPKWTGKIAAEGVDLSALILDCPQIQLTAVDGDMHGDIGHYRGFVKARGSWDAFQGIELAGQLDGDGRGIDFQSLRIEREDSLAVVKNGKINWRDIFGWEGRFSFKNIDLSDITGQLSGIISAELISSGEVTEKGVVAAFDIAELEGLLRDQRVSVHGQVSLGETAVYTNGLTVKSGDIQGVANIDRAMFSWAQHPSWAAEIRLENFDPALLHPEFYGKVNAHFSGSGRRGEKGVEGHISIGDVSGNLRGHELAGGGDIQLLGNTFTTTGLALTSGLSELTLEGRAGADLGAIVTFSTADLSAFLPGATGKVSVHGSLSGDINTPRLALEIDGVGLRYGDHTAGQLQAHFKAELKEDAVFTGNVEANRLGLSGVTVNGAKIEISGSVKDHEITVAADAPALQLGGRARGRYDNGEWRGKLAQILLQAPGHGSWKQQQETNVTLGSIFRIDELCLENGPSDMCLGGSINKADRLRWGVSGRVRSVPIDFLNSLHLNPAHLQGVISGEIVAEGDGGAIASARLQVTVPDLIFLIDSESPDTYPFHLNDSSVKIDLVDGSLVGNLVTLTENGGKAAMEIRVEDVVEFSDSLQNKTIVGHFQLEDFDLSIFEGFTAYGVEPAGLLNSAFVLSGTLGQPTVKGDAAIKNGGIELLYQGVTLNEVTLTVAVEGQQATVSGAATSGPGRMQITGNLQYDESGAGGTLRLRGNDFLLVDLPEYLLQVASDVQVDFNREGGSIRGRVEVPYGLLTPEEIVNSVDVSEDVVFINGDMEEEQAGGWPLVLDLDVILGDDVRLDGYGLTGRLGGRLHVKSSKDNILAGKGQLDLIEGIFSLYGRTLNIERGRVLFTGGPIDNPGLDVRAQVKVSDEEARGKGYTVGVDISGLVQDLQFTLFSDPYMEDAEILSMMIVGQSLTGDSGEDGNILKSAAASLGLKGGSKLTKGLGDLLPIDDVRLEGSGSKEDFSLVVGKRVSQDLYIGYDMNMFSQLGQFRVRYDLKKGFAVETTSSSGATGADLLYSFER